jgi:hypothetical protein
MYLGNQKKSRVNDSYDICEGDSCHALCIKEKVFSDLLLLDVSTPGRQRVLQSEGFPSKLCVADKHSDSRTSPPALQSARRARGSPAFRHGQASNERPRSIPQTCGGQSSHLYHSMQAVKFRPANPSTTKPIETPRLFPAFGFQMVVNEGKHTTVPHLGSPAVSTGRKRLEEAPTQPARKFSTARRTNMTAAAQPFLKGVPIRKIHTHLHLSSAR